MEREDESETVHERFMQRAIALARRGMGRVSPNPLVGAVLVKNGRIVAEGYHLYQKENHAEVVALEKAGRLAAGASLYLNLARSMSKSKSCRGLRSSSSARTARLRTRSFKKSESSPRAS